MKVAKGIQNHPTYKLGHIFEPEAIKLRLTPFIGKDVQAPVSWDFDKTRKPFPKKMWGNDAYGDCELAARANYLLRVQRVQTKTTPGIDDNDVINLYKQMTGCQTPGDNNDTGLTTLDNLSQWKGGWSISKVWQLGGQQTRNYHISAYGSIDIKNAQMVRNAIYLFTGGILGIDMPVTVQQQMDAGQPWDYDPSAGADAAPGSWGGHAIYTRGFDDGGLKCYSWAEDVYLTNAFISNYVTEIYCVVDSFDTWFKFPHALDVSGLEKEMQSLGITVQQ